jgi:hypothetical protein
MWGSDICQHSLALHVTIYLENMHTIVDVFLKMQIFMTLEDLCLFPA